MKHWDLIHREFAKIAAGVSLMGETCDGDSKDGDPLQCRFESFYDAAYGGWTYPDPHTQQVIMDAPSNLFGLIPSR